LNLEGVKNPAEPPRLDNIGGRYPVVREIGRGGMATVYLCTDMRTGRPVAVKVLRPELGSAVVVERFAREIEFASRLVHPRIPQVLDSGVVGDLPFYVMTYVEGESLRAVLDREKQLPIERAIQITLQVIEPMAFAHAMGIVHRDIKPGNILIGNDGVYVLDFGIARAILASSDERLTSTGVAIGTPAYMSPEQALSEKDIDTRSDIYSLGCVTYEMIAGMPPFVGATAQVVMSRRFVASPPPLRESRDSVPSFVEAAVGKALARSPADRWQKAEEFGRALSATPTQVAAEAARKTRNRRIARGLLLVLALFILVGGAWTWREAHGDSPLAAANAANVWEFDRAEQILRRVVAKKPDDATAQLWLAQVMMLEGAPAKEWQASLLVASDHRSALSASESKRLDALSSYNAGKLAEACARFDQLRSMTAPESRSDFTPTLAFADCARDDQSVVPDRTSPSGYRFASSYNYVDSLYENLLTRASSNPLAYAALIPRLQTVLSVDSRILRRGFLADRPKVVLYSQPTLVSDTLSYVPFVPPSDGSAMKLGETNLVNAAMSRNQERLRNLVSQWTRIAPDDPAAHALLGTFLEAAGDLDGGSSSAIQELTRARQLSNRAELSSPAGYTRQTALANTTIRVLVRLGQYERAGILADSVLDWRAPTELSDTDKKNSLDVLWRLAALRGRVSRVNEIEQQYVLAYRIRLSSGIETPPPVIARDAISVRNYAAFGGPKDSIVAITQRLFAEVPALTAASKVAEMEGAILYQALCLATPVVGAANLLKLKPSSDPVVRAFQAYARGDRRAAKRYIDSLTALHADRAPGEVSMDATYNEAWLTAALGDTARAARLLDNALGGISKAPQSMMGSPLLIASLVRAMLLRAELAQSMGQLKVAAKWSTSSDELWGKGDSSIVARVAR
jgi:tetratricopeptide (TPR) repeat protein/predicted Ser/Thr protein kinase